MNHKHTLLGVLGLFMSASFGLITFDLFIKFIFSFGDSVFSRNNPMVTLQSLFSILFIIGIFIYFLRWLKEHGRNKLIGFNVLIFFICLIFAARVWSGLSELIKMLGMD
ncbi:hypothetical protein R70723_07615 [Paenibacillus sp. FSL R7-0273]|nr:hypothetical protein R70723_07615 [Paenibacillus sp. FSL R7-0273]OMF95288.1 hypothetical protein BK144_07120 [Paenibacillus sp. FSL R7-0273]